MEKLRSKYDFQLVRRRGKKHSSPYFDVFFLPGGSEKRFRCGVVVSKKFSKKAVERNRARRLVFEALRLAGSSSLPRGDCLFYLKPRMLGVKVFDVQEELNKILPNLNR